uniref:Uncharacterized protein n=1 Tax=Glossina pallidipes TaxID=7398 RepID=A0A1B0A9E1_GLOPL
MSKIDQEKLKPPYFRKRGPSVLWKLKQPYFREQVEFGLVAFCGHLHNALKMSATAIPIFRVERAVTPHFRDEINPTSTYFRDLSSPTSLISNLRLPFGIKAVVTRYRTQLEHTFATKATVTRTICLEGAEISLTFGTTKGNSQYTATLAFKDKISWKFSKLARGDKAAITHLTEKVKDKLTHLTD